MSRRRSRRGRGMSLTFALVIFAAMAVVGAVADVAEHLVLLVPVPAVAAVAFAVGRRYERRRRFPAAVQSRPPEAATRPLPEVPAVADQVAELEALAGRPIEAIIGTYRHLQAQYQIRGKR